MPKVAVIVVIFAPKAITDMDNNEKEIELTSGPSQSTFSRARGKLDLFGMLARQWEWRQIGFASQWISLCKPAAHKPS